MGFRGDRSTPQLAVWLLPRFGQQMEALGLQCHFSFSVVSQLDCARVWFLLALFGGLALLTWGSALPAEGPVPTLRAVVYLRVSSSHALLPSTCFVPLWPWPQVSVGITVRNGPAGPGPPVGFLLLSFPGSPVTTLLTSPQEQAYCSSGLPKALDLE